MTPIPLAILSLIFRLRDCKGEKRLKPGVERLASQDAETPQDGSSRNTDSSLYWTPFLLFSAHQRSVRLVRDFYMRNLTLCCTILTSGGIWCAISSIMMFKQEIYAGGECYVLKPPVDTYFPKMVSTTSILRLTLYYQIFTPLFHHKGNIFGIYLISCWVLIIRLTSLGFKRRDDDL